MFLSTYRPSVTMPLSLIPKLSTTSPTTFLSLAKLVARSRLTFARPLLESTSINQTPPSNWTQFCPTRSSCGLVFPMAPRWVCSALPLRRFTNPNLCCSEGYPSRTSSSKDVGRPRPPLRFLPISLEILRLRLYPENLGE